MRETGAWHEQGARSQETLRERTHLSLDTIRVGINQLAASGHLRRIKRGNQITHASQYKFLAKERRS